MEHRIMARNLGSNTNNENPIMATKGALTETPRKMPFKDTTNKASELLKSAVKGSNKANEKIQLKEQGASPQTFGHEQEAVKIDKFDDFDMEPFIMPNDKNCYCCGDNRKTDGEVWGEKMALSKEFMEKLLSFSDRIEEDFQEPMSPVKALYPIRIENDPQSPIKRLEMPKLPTFYFDSSLDDSCNKTDADFDDVEDEWNSSLEVPDFELDFTIGADESGTAMDASIIQDW